MKLYCRQYGKGLPLIILHGLYGSSDNWVSMAKRLSTSFSVCLPDLRNHGRSPHSEVHDYESMSEDINELAASLGIKDFFLAGHSMGGKVAMTFACRYPLLVKGLIVADISPFSEQPERESAFDQHQNILKAIIETDLSEAVKRENIENQLSVHIESEKIRGLIMKSLERTGPESFRWRLNAAALMNNLGNIIGDIPVAGEDFNEITGFPVIFLKGEKSDYISPHNFKKALRLFPGAELRVIRNAGHWLHVNNPDAVIAAFNDLLNY